MIDFKKYLEEINSRIIQQFQPEKIYVFGSYAREEVKEESDLDILVEFSSVSNKRNTIIAIRKLLADLPIAKDILVATSEEISIYMNKNWSIYSQAIKEGKIIYERKAA